MSMTAIFLRLGSMIAVMLVVPVRITMVLEVMGGVVGVADGLGENGTERDGRTLSCLVLYSGVSMALLRMVQQVVHWRLVS